MSKSYEEKCSRQSEQQGQRPGVETGWYIRNGKKVSVVREKRVRDAGKEANWMSHSKSAEVEMSRGVIWLD